MPYYSNKPLKRDSFIDRNANYFQSILGSLSDYSTKNTLAEYENDMKNYAERYKSFNQYKNVKKKLTDTELTREELDYLQNQNSIDLTDPGILSSDAFTKHSAASPPPINPITGKADYSNPEYAKKFYETIKDNPDYSKFIKQTKITPTGEDLIKARMLKAGLTDEEKKLYDEYKNFDVNEYNRSLEENMIKHYPELVSQGPLGDKLAQVYAKRLKLNELTDMPPEKRNIEFHDGYMFKFDDSGNEISREKIKDDEEKAFKLSDDSTIIPYTDESGAQAYGWFEPNPKSNDFGQKGWKFTGVNPTQDQIDEFNRSGKYEKKKSGTGGRRGGKGTVNYSQEQKSLAGDLAKFGKLNKTWNAWRNEDPLTQTDEQKKAMDDYEQLKNSLIGYFDGDYDALNKYAESVYSGNSKDIPGLIDEILGGSEQTDAENETIDDIFDDEDMTGTQATLIYEKSKDQFKTKAGQKYFKQKYLQKIGAK